MLDRLLQTARAIAIDPTIAANASITFTQPIAGTITVGEDDLGNPIVEDTEVTTVTLSCWLRQRSRPQSDVLRNINLDSEYFEGRLVEPKTYDFPIKNYSNAIASVNGKTGLITQLRFLESPSSQQHDIKSVLGQKLACYIQFKESE